MRHVADLLGGAEPARDQRRIIPGQMQFTRTRGVGESAAYLITYCPV